MFKKAIGVLFASLALAKNQKSTCTIKSRLNDEDKEAGVMAIINKEMCSVNCPCSSSSELTYFTLGEEALNKHSRSFYSSQNGNRQMRFVDHGRTFESFKQCWEQRLAGSSLYDIDFVEDVNQYLEVMENLEDQFKCSGFC